jgi:5'-deoxynucleotidase YfbR-like HD superfamily hydrolase
MKALHMSGSTRRYHTVCGLEQDVAAHSWGVAIILTRLHPNPSMNLIKAALYHDCAEKYTGDLPATIKWANPQLKKEMLIVEETWERELGIEIKLNEEDARWLKVADMLELILFCERAGMMGNQYALEIKERGLQYLRDMRPLPKEVIIFLQSQDWI